MTFSKSVTGQWTGDKCNRQFCQPLGELVAKEVLAVFFREFHEIGE